MAFDLKKTLLLSQMCLLLKITFPGVCLFTKCSWIFSSPQEAGSRTASLKRSNQVKGLRHSRSVSCLFSATLQFLPVDSLSLPSARHDDIFLRSFLAQCCSIYGMKRPADIPWHRHNSPENPFWLWHSTLQFSLLLTLVTCITKSHTHVLSLFQIDLRRYPLDEQNCTLEIESCE